MKQHWKARVRVLRKKRSIAKESMNKTSSAKKKSFLTKPSSFNTVLGKKTNMSTEVPVKAEELRSPKNLVKKQTVL
jgi:hypothetical protein